MYYILYMSGLVLDTSNLLKLTKQTNSNCPAWFGVEKCIRYHKLIIIINQTAFSST